MHTRYGFDDIAVFSIEEVDAAPILAAGISESEGIALGYQVFLVEDCDFGCEGADGSPEDSEKKTSFHLEPRMS